MELMIAKMNLMREIVVCLYCFRNHDIYFEMNEIPYILIKDQNTKQLLGKKEKFLTHLWTILVMVKGTFFKIIIHRIPLY